MTSDSNVRKAGKFPKGPSTMRAEVLAVLLASEDMTGFESIFAHRKTGLNTVIRGLDEVRVAYRTSRLPNQYRRRQGSMGFGVLPAARGD